MNSKIKLIALLAFILIFSSAFSQKKFPKFSNTTLSNKPIDNSYFINKKTVVVLFHLGCPPASVLVEDLKTLSNTLDSNQYQVLFILQNTKDQVVQYNTEEKNDWSDLRKALKMSLIKYEMIAECEIGKSNLQGEDGYAMEECRKITKKLKTESSPSMVIVDENGKYNNLIRGYYSYGTDINERLVNLKSRIGITK
jgi:thioredoxin-related protein